MLRRGNWHKGNLPLERGRKTEAWRYDQFEAAAERGHTASRCVVNLKVCKLNIESLMRMLLGGSASSVTNRET